MKTVATNRAIQDKISALYCVISHISIIILCRWMVYKPSIIWFIHEQTHTRMYYLNLSSLTLVFFFPYNLNFESLLGFRLFRTIHSTSIFHPNYERRRRDDQTFCLYIYVYVGVFFFIWYNHEIFFSSRSCSVVLARKILC
jgi:hypothetical protein